MEASQSNSKMTADWQPSAELIDSANMTWLQRRVGAPTYEALHAWTTQNRGKFWEMAIERLGIQFRRPHDSIMEWPAGQDQPPT